MLAVLVCALCGSSRVAAQAADQDLAKQLTNPVSDLVSVPFQFNWENNVGPDDRGMRMVLNFQPVVPIPLSDRWNLIARWIMPYIAQPEALGSSSGFGDVVFSTFFSPARPSTLIWGVGPVLSLPMTTDPTLGAGKWSAGPTAVVLRSQRGWTYGMLVNQLWSFANASSDDRAVVSQAFIQPFIAHVTAGGVTYNLTSEATVNWSAQDSGDRWTVPIILQVSKLTRLGPLPLSVLAGAGWYVATPDAGPDWKLRTAFVILLPRTAG
jgi:hypothetical protein